MLDYFTKEKTIFITEIKKCRDRLNRIWHEYEQSIKDRLEFGYILPTQTKFIFNIDKVKDMLAEKRSIGFLNLDSNMEEFSTKNILSIRTVETSSIYKNFEILENDLNKYVNGGFATILLSGTKAKTDRVINELSERGVILSYSDKLDTTPAPKQIIISKGSLSKGFLYEGINFVILTDKDLFGKDKERNKSRKKYKGAKIESFLELLPGDYVVHEMHGIGVFQGIEQIVIEGVSRDNLKIQYAENSLLYVNINQMDMVQKYVGSDDNIPKLHTLGTPEWKKSKAKVRGAVADIAKELISLYSKRENQRGFAYEPDTVWQAEFEELFPYSETDDQLEAINAVKSDMESNKIMDRLICGDVGYGKTEVAIRAAFKAVMNRKQVAYLVPTTILAQQHYQRFVERMEVQGISVGVLSRFRTPKQIKETLAALEKGVLDIVIGTHRLLSKDVKFDDLGLVIIDEEQRFGVTHKEKLKQLRTEVDVLTLTATPIPRTLHMSLIGIRDMSVIEEAPLKRVPVQTYVMEYSDEFIKDAINREINRDGQVYFLYNKVKNIEETAVAISAMVPQATVAFAHGQMSERELEKIMIQFMNKEISVLVCTTIIETGLDIANANTIIINDADKMGLSQLYQLRGRVGRSDKGAYAYLLYKKDKVLSEVAERRLQAIRQFTQLGAGFKIAMRDLEIRGAGDLLGAKQHGHMEAIGYDLYSKMLKEAILYEQGENVKPSVETTIEIKINAFIPSTFIIDEVQKLDIYKKIALIRTEKDLDNIVDEMQDRYGDLPQSVYNLVDIALIKAIANDLEISLISHNQHMIMIRFNEVVHLDPLILSKVVDIYQDKVKVTLGKQVTLTFNVKDINRKELIGHVKKLVLALKEL
ncbi:MAG: transcription-repair coupling factor, partial [Epulopiscium sp. Nele67-Bin002]